MPRSHITSLLLISVLAGAAFGQPTREPRPWPQFRGPTGQGVSHVEAPPIAWTGSGNPVWKAELPGPGGSSPIVWGEHIYVTCYTGYAVPGTATGDLDALRRHLLCLDRADGRVLWRQEVPAVQPEQAKVREHGYASSTPAADRDRVYVFFGKSGVLAFTHEGRQVWRADVGSQAHGWGSAASPLLHKNLVILNAGVESESLVALDRSTGREIWRAGGIQESWNTPILVTVEGAATELVVAILGKVLGFDPDTGALHWSCATGIAWYMVPSMVSKNDVVYCIGGRTGGALAVRAGGRGDVTESRRLWTLSKGSNVSSPLYHDGHLYWLHDNLGIAYCADAATGKLAYEERIPGASQFYASPVLVDGRIYCVSRSGRVFVLAAKPTFQVLTSHDLADRSSFDASPAVDGPRLLIRSDRHLYCLGEQE